MKSDIPCNFSLHCTALAFAHVSFAEDSSDFDWFFSEPTEGVYGNEWFIMWQAGWAEDTGLGGYTTEYFSIRRKGQLYWEGAFQTACRNKSDGARHVSGWTCLRPVDGAGSLVGD